MIALLGAEAAPAGAQLLLRLLALWMRRWVLGVRLRAWQRHLVVL